MNEKLRAAKEALLLKKRQEAKEEKPKRQKKPEKLKLDNDRLRTPDIEDIEHLEGKTPNYVMGWNKVKYNQTASEMPKKKRK